MKRQPSTAQTRLRFSTRYSVSSSTIMIMLILRMGSVMSVGFEKVYLLQNSLNNATSEIIATYVYKMGLLKSQYSLSAAIGLFNNVINLILLLVFNFISAKISEDSLF